MDWWVTPKFLYLWGPQIIDWTAWRTSPAAAFFLSAEDSALLGYWFAFVILVLYGIAANLLFIGAYDKFKLDLLGLEEPKNAVQEKLKQRPIASRLAAISGWALFAWLTFVWTDPILATIVMRKDARAYRMSTRDWIIFWSAVCISILMWIVQVSGFVEVVGKPFLAEYWAQLLAWLEETIPWLHWVLA